MEMQKIFKATQLDNLLTGLHDNELEQYYQPMSSYPGDAILESNTIETEGSLPRLDPEHSDLENAKKLYEHYPSLDVTQASDKRFWAYLAHVTFREYVQLRWGPKGTWSDVKDDEGAKQKAILNIRDHWFVMGNDRKLRRHALAKLWWAVRLTCNPDEADPKLAEHTAKDPYVYTEILLSNEDLYSAIMERQIFKSPQVRYGVLEFIRQNPEYQGRTLYRPLMREIVLLSGVKRLYLLNNDQVTEAIATAAK